MIVKHLVFGSRDSELFLTLGEIQIFGRGGSRQSGGVMGWQHRGAFWFIAFSFIAVSTVATEPEFRGDVSRAVHKVNGSDGRPAGVTWVVQLSDLHLSVYRPERAQALEKLMAPLIATVQPALVLVTGDLTDAESEDETKSQQYEEEWITYQRVIDGISKESEIELKRFYDIRGNHDKYGVPYTNSSLDYYSRYSCNARQGRTGLVHSVTLVDDSGWKNLFVGVDDSISVGLREPSNLFGHPTDQSLAELDAELGQWDNDTTGPITKMVFGHFPLAWTTSSGSGRRPEEVMAKHNISGYICGHLHCGFGRQLYKHHVRKRLGEFWEWEMGDWRINRMMRIVAIDHGRVSFVDVDLKQSSDDVLNGKEFVMPTIILPTSPLDSRLMLPSSPVPGQANVGAIRALVFSKSRPISVTARLFDSVAHLTVHHIFLESLQMNLVSGPSSEGQGGSFFYEAQWDSRNYTDSSATRYWLQIQVIESGEITASRMWPFSVEGHNGHFSLTFLGYLAIGVDWEAAYPLIQWTIICVIFGGFLIVPRFVFLYLERNGVYDRWALSVCHSIANSKFPDFRLPLWALLEGARNPFLWWGQVLYISFLVMFPWFWGNVLADDYPIGYMTLRGWTVWPHKDTVAQQSNVGWPDIMAVVLPYMCAVVVPMVMMVSALCAEQAACELEDAVTRQAAGLLAKRADAKRTNGEGEVTSRVGLGRLFNEDAGGEERRPLLEDVQDSSRSAEEKLEASSADDEETVVMREKRSPWSCFHRKIRRVCFVACVLVATLHLWLCLSLKSAYGAQVFLSPIYVWTVPALIAASLFMTSPIKPRNL